MCLKRRGAGLSRHQGEKWKCRKHGPLAPRAAQCLARPVRSDQHVQQRSASHNTPLGGPPRFHTCAQVNMNSGTCLQNFFDDFVDGTHSLRRTHHVEIIQVGEQMLVKMKRILNLLRNTKLSQSIQHGHQCITLFAFISLVDIVSDGRNRLTTGAAQVALIPR